MNATWNVFKTSSALIMFQLKPGLLLVLYLDYVINHCS